MHEKGVDYQTMLNASDELAYLSDTEGNILATNQPGTTRLGTELHDSRFANLTKLNNQHLQDAIKRKAAVNVEQEQDGKVFNVFINPIMDEKGEVKEVATFVRDITRQKAIENCLRRSEEESRAWLEHSPVCTKKVDLDFNIHYMSQAGLKALKIDDPETIYGKPYPLPFYPIEFKEGMIEKLNKVKNGEGVQELEAPICDIYGTELWFHSTVVPVHDDKGKIDYIIVVSVNITETKHAETKLRHSEKMNAIGKLAGGIAHDFNNQLAAIIGYTELLLEDIEDPELKKHAKRIRNAAARSADMTNQLLAFARKGDFKNIPTDMHKLIGDVIDLLRPSLDKRVKVRKSLAAAEWVCEADATQIESALLNVALNANDAMSGDGELTFSTDSVVLDQDDCNRLLFNIIPGKYLRIDVSDTGEGMTEETQRRMFEPFFTTKSVGKGTGLGLAGVYGAVERHKGAITVKSELGKGSTLTVFLPLCDSAADQVAHSGEDSPNVKTASAHILVVDDEEDLRDVATLSLGRDGYQVTTAKDGLEGVDTYRKFWKEIDLVILDMSMPKMSGPDAYAEMKKINPDVKVILCSGYDLSGDQQETLKDGILSFVRKPYRRSELLKEVARALST